MSTTPAVAPATRRRKIVPNTNPFFVPLMAPSMIPPAADAGGGPKNRLTKKPMPPSAAAAAAAKGTMLESCPSLTNTPPVYTEAAHLTNDAVGSAQRQTLNTTDIEQPAATSIVGDKAKKRKTGNDPVSRPSKRIDIHVPQNDQLSAKPAAIVGSSTSVKLDGAVVMIVRNPHHEDIAVANPVQEKHNLETTDATSAFDSRKATPTLENEYEPRKDDEENGDIHSPVTSIPAPKPAIESRRNVTKNTAGIQKSCAKSTTKKVEEPGIIYGRSDRELDTAGRKKCGNLQGGRSLLKKSMKAFATQHETYTTHMRSVRQTINPTQKAPIRVVGVLPSKEAANPMPAPMTRGARILKPIHDTALKPAEANEEYVHPEDGNITVVKLPKNSLRVKHQGTYIPVKELITDCAFHIVWPHVRIMGDFDESHWRLEKQTVTHDERMAMFKANRNKLTQHNRRVGAKNRISKRPGPNARGIDITKTNGNTESPVSALSGSQSSSSSDRVASGRVTKRTGSHKT
jgi:hypothetical protein